MHYNVNNYLLQLLSVNGVLLQDLCLVFLYPEQFCYTVVLFNCCKILTCDVKCCIWFSPTGVQDFGFLEHWHQQSGGQSGN